MRIFCFIAILSISSVSRAQVAPQQSLKRQLSEVIEQGDVHRLIQLCGAPAPIQALEFDHKEQGALHYTAKKHQAELIPILVSDCGFDPNQVDETGTPPLYYARMSPSTVSMLLEFGADPNQIIKETDLPIISQFLLNPVPRASLEPFLAYDVNLTQKSATGMTPLMYAVISRHKTNVEFLIDAMKEGFDLAHQERLGDNKKSAVELASPEVAALLAENGIE